MKPIYFDYAATTPIDPRVAQAMFECSTEDGIFGNPASLHAYGQAALAIIEYGREQVAGLIHADPSEIIWTSGATESNNLALKGVAHLYKRKGKHIITLQTEHKAVLDVCQYLEKNGYSVTYLKPQKNGLLDLDHLKEALRDDTILVSIMHVNNETGVIQDLDAIAKLTSDRGILFHVDAAQTPGKCLIDVSKTPIDLISLSAHKVYGPKGIGALYLRKKPRVRVEPLIHGGGHEQGMRSGTLATHQIAGIGRAYEIIQAEMPQEIKKIKSLRTEFLNGIKNISNFHLNADSKNTVPHILNVRFEGMIADALLEEISIICTSTASACQGKGIEGSYVLRAMGYTAEQIKSSIRFSFGRFTTSENILEAVRAINKLFRNRL